MPLFAHGIYSLLHALFGFVIAIALLRFYLQKFRVSVHNPLGRFVIAVSNPVIVPLRRVIPGWKGMDLSTLVVAVAVGGLLALIEVQLLYRGAPNVLRGMLIVAVGGVYNALVFSIQLFIWLMIAHAVLSWVNPNHWAFHITGHLTEFLRRPVANLIPPIGGVDISMIVVFLLLQLLVLPALGYGWEAFLWRLLQP